MFVQTRSMHRERARLCLQHILSNEILSKILQYLNVFDLCGSISQVNKQFYNILTKTILVKTIQPIRIPQAWHSLSPTEVLSSLFKTQCYRDNCNNVIGLTGKRNTTRRAALSKVSLPLYIILFLSNVLFIS